MATLTWYGRLLEDLRLAATGRDRIEDIPTATFNALLKEHLSGGWSKVYVYEGFDAWIDYGRVDLRKDGRTLSFEWDNWFEGEITGPTEAIRELSTAIGLPVVPWRRPAWGRK